MILNTKDIDVKKYVGNGRVLCLDYGDKRIGVAVSDINWAISSPLVVLESKGVYSKIFDIIKKYNAQLILVGAPVSLCGGEGGKQYEKVKKFVEKLLSLMEIDVLFWDERLSTCGAMRYIEEIGINNSGKKKIIDKLAASFILEGFLNYTKFNL